MLRLSLLAALACVLPPQSTFTAPRNGAPSLQEVLPLGPGKPVEWELKGSETYRFALTLAAGQFAEVEVEQLGRDVLIGFWAPDKTTLFEFSANDMPTGKERACFVAEQAGTYYVQVRPVTSDETPARCRIRMTQLREATAADTTRVAAQAAMAEAFNFKDSQIRDSMQQAVPKYEAALALARQAGDQKLEADILLLLGDDYRAIHDQPKAIAYLEQALQLSRTLGAKSEEARTLLKLSFCHAEVGENPQARERLQQALPLYREVGDQGGEGRALYLMAESYARQSPQLAIAYYQQAVPLLRAAGDVSYVVDSLYSIGLSWLQMGEPQKSFAALFQALPLAERHPIKDLKANTLDNLSKVYQATGEYQKALDAQYEALAIRESIGGVEGAANSYRYLGSIYLDLGEPQRAAAARRGRWRVAMDSVRGPARARIARRRRGEPGGV